MKLESLFGFLAATNVLSVQPSYRLFDFDIGHKLGAGGFASVYVATYKPTKQVVALKKLSTANSKIDWLHETSILEKVNGCPNVIQYLGRFSSGGNYYIVLEFAPKGTLSYFYRNFTSTAKKFIAAQVLTGIECIHSRNLVHGDLKRSNILLFDGFVAKIADFGLSWDIDSGTQLLMKKNLMEDDWHMMREILKKELHTGQSPVSELLKILPTSILGDSANWEKIKNRLDWERLETLVYSKKLDILTEDVNLLSASDYDSDYDS